MKPLHSKLLIAGLILVVLGMLAVAAGVFITTLGMTGSFEEAAAAPEGADASELADGIAASLTAAGVGIVAGVALGGAGVLLAIAAAAGHLCSRRNDGAGNAGGAVQ